MAIYQAAELRIIPKIIKSKNGVPTVIEWNGQRYVLDHANQFKPEKKPIKVKNNKVTIK